LLGAHRLLAGRAALLAARACRDRCAVTSSVRLAMGAVKRGARPEEVLARRRLRARRTDEAVPARSGGMISTDPAPQ